MNQVTLFKSISQTTLSVLLRPCLYTHRNNLKASQIKAVWNHGESVCCRLERTVPSKCDRWCLSLNTETGQHIVSQLFVGLPPMCVSEDESSLYSQCVAAPGVKSWAAGHETHHWLSCISGQSFCSSHGNCPTAFRIKHQHTETETVIRCRHRWQTLFCYRIINWKIIHLLWSCGLSTLRLTQQKTKAFKLCNL